jgi:hypothetical protein
MTMASYKNYSALEAAELRVREAGEWLKLEDGLMEAETNSPVGECTTTPPVGRQKAEFVTTMK